MIVLFLPVNGKVEPAIMRDQKELATLDKTLNLVT